jgi:hypothetical protein
MDENLHENEKLKDFTPLITFQYSQVLLNILETFGYALSCLSQNFGSLLTLIYKNFQ